jgi:hypothetical protein
MAPVLPDSAHPGGSPLPTDKGPGPGGDLGEVRVTMPPDPLNAWAEEVIPLANDCLMGFLTWEEYRAELRKIADQLHFKYED